MKRDFERVLRPAVLLCALPYALVSAAPSLNAQANQPADGSVLVDEAAIMRHVLGDPAAAQLRLEEGLESASKKERPRILAELTMLYEGMKQKEHRDRTLTHLARDAGPYGAWAKKKLAEGASSVHQSKLEDWVRDLDSSRSDIVRIARRELDRLGVLAVPEVIRQLPAFGPRGLRNGLNFIVPFAGAEIEQVLRQMLASGDPIHETVASEVLDDLRGEMRTELVLLSLKSKAEIVQVRAADALIGIDSSKAVAVLDRLSRSRSQEVRRLVIQSCFGQALAENSRVGQVVDRLVGDSDSAVSEAARECWIARYGTEDTERVTRWLLELDDHAAQHVITGLLKSHDPNSELLLQGLRFPSLVSQVLTQVSRDDLRGHEELLVAALKAVPIDFGEIYDRRVRDQDLLYEALTALRVRSAVPTLLTVVENPSKVYSGYAWTAIAGIDASVLINQHERLSDDRWRFAYLELLTSSAGPRQMEQVVRAVKSINGQPGIRVSHRVSLSTRTGRRVRPENHELLQVLITFGGRSDASNLSEALALVTVPEKNTMTVWSWTARRDAVLEAFRRWFGAEHVTIGLKSIWTVDSIVAKAILGESKKFVGAEHLDVLIETLAIAKQRGLGAYKFEERLQSERPLSSHEVAHSVLFLLAQIDDPRAQAAIVQFCGDAKLGIDAVEALRDSPVFDPATWLKPILSNKPSRLFVDAVIGMPLVAKDETLRKLAIAIVGEGWSYCKDTPKFIAALSAEERLGLAKEILKQRNDKDCSSLMMATALKVIGDRRSEEFVELLAMGRDSSDTEVRMLAVEQLLRTYSRKIVPHLIEALKDDHASVRRAAESSLEQLDKYYTLSEKWEKRLLKSGK